MANRNGNLEDVQQFLDTYRGGEPSEQQEAWSQYHPAVPRRFDTEICYPASRSTTTCDQESEYTYDSRSSRTHTTRSPSIFSQSTAAQSTFESEAPPTDWPSYDVVGGDGRTLWCEFHRLTGCNAVFRGEKESTWSQHHIHHLEDSFPAKLVCWFCDDYSFVSKHKSDRRANFENRMKHVRQHIRREPRTSNHMRPDFFMVDHLYRIGQIDDEMYATAMGYEELPAHLRPQLPADDGPAITLSSGAVCDDLEKEIRQQNRQAKAKKQEGKHRSRREGERRKW